MEIFPESSDEVFLKELDAEITFNKGPDGRAQSIVVHENGQNLTGVRMNP
jgi:hypothetical protein